MTNKPEPRYVDDDDMKPMSRPKWQYPSTPFQKRVLRLVAYNGLKYFPSKPQRSKIIEIERAMLPLSPGVISIYPTEWVESVLTWVKMRQDKHQPLTLWAIIHTLENEDRKQVFIICFLKVLEGKEVAPIDEDDLTEDTFSQYREE